jgi:hypothetical protein
VVSGNRDFLDELLGFDTPDSVEAVLNAELAAELADLDDIEGDLDLADWDPGDPDLPEDAGDVRSMGGFTPGAYTPDSVLALDTEFFFDESVLDDDEEDDDDDSDADIGDDDGDAIYADIERE